MEKLPPARKRFVKDELIQSRWYSQRSKNKPPVFSGGLFLYDAYLVCQAQEVDPIPFVMSSFFT
jgi:hypothetical protein